uniref:Glycosyltransferase family 92 protein n=1 Tax=Dicentrarchus labrax TaxID=13489 RepID=A0A8C4ETC2_DICLA
MQGIDLCFLLNSCNNNNNDIPNQLLLAPNLINIEYLLIQIRYFSKIIKLHSALTLTLPRFICHKHNLFLTSSSFHVRVIAVVLRSETVAYRCLLCCHDQLYISEGVSNIHTDHFGFAYGTSTVQKCDCQNVSVVLFCGHLDKHDKEFLEVNNQKAINDSFPYNFTVCLSTMFDFTNVLQLVQGLEMLQLLGVNRVVIYKTSNSPEIKHVLDYYTQKGLVEVIPWSMSRFLNVSRGWLPEHGPGDLHYFGQIPALNDFIYRYMYQSRYVALQDIDELILPQSKYGADKCYMFENNVFPNTITLPPPTSETLPPQSRCCPGWQNVSGVNILAHLYQEPIIKETHYSNFKIIVNPRAVFIPTVHGLLHSLNGCSWVDRNIPIEQTLTHSHSHRSHSIWGNLGFSILLKDSSGRPALLKRLISYRKSLKQECQSFELIVNNTMSLILPVGNMRRDAIMLAK